MYTFAHILVIVLTAAFLATGLVNGRESSIRGESNGRALMGKGKDSKTKDTMSRFDDGSLGGSLCDQYDGSAGELCETYCGACDMNMMELDDGYDDAARNSTKSTKSKKSGKKQSDKETSGQSCAEIKSNFQSITGEDLPCERCPCWTKNDLMEIFPDRDLLTGDSCYDYLPGDDSQIYLSDNVTFALPQDDANGLFENGTHYCLMDTLGGPMTIDEKTARICIETLASHCEVLGIPVEEFYLPPI